MHLHTVAAWQLRNWGMALVFGMVSSIATYSLLYGQPQTPRTEAEYLPARDVAFQSSRDGSEQRYVLLMPRAAAESYDVLIALHGHGSDRWQFVNDGRPECAGARLMAAGRNMIYVSPDYRAKTSWMGPDAEADLLQIIDRLHAEYRIGKIVIAGGSMGGTSALAFAAMHPEMVDGVVSMNGTANMLEYQGFAEAIAASYGGSPQEKPEVYRQRSAELFADRLTMPIAVTTGGKDNLVPPDSTLRLVEKLKAQNRSSEGIMKVLSLHRPEGGHSTTLDDTQSAFRFVFDALAAQKAAPEALEPPIDPSNARPIVCLGDSVTGVYYHSGGQRAYPEMLEIGLQRAFQSKQLRVVNAGVSGNTTVDGLARLERDVLAHRPSVVTISFGLNDMTRVPLDQYRKNLEQLIERCRAVGSQVVLCTPNAVIDTPDRPIEKLVVYCDVVRAVGRDRGAPVCDQYAAGLSLRARAPWTWRMTMSDAIHPNMDGHKRMAEELCHTISGRRISLDAVEPSRPALGWTRKELSAGQTVDVLVMEPLAELFPKAINAAVVKRIPSAAKSDSSRIQFKAWPVEGKSLSELEQAAKAQVRAMKPDLVVLTLPSKAIEIAPRAGESKSAADERLVASFSWLMNWSLSFGTRQWDCVVIHPSLVGDSLTSEQDWLLRRLVRAQHLFLLERQAGDTESSEAILQRWIEEDWGRAPNAHP